jgi:predicted amidophosphoribosyltransferase
MSRNPHVCPQCSARVSAFAAGCAICGAPLDPRRAQSPRNLSERLGRLFGRRRRPDVSAEGR